MGDTFEFESVLRNHVFSLSTNDRQKSSIIESANACENLSSNSLLTASKN